MASPSASLLHSGLATARTPLLRIAACSAIESAPALAAGAVTAAAIDQGFLAGRPMVGLAWLTLLTGLHLLRAVAERAVFPHLAAVVEPLRDHLVERLVRGALHRAAGRGARPGAADPAAVSQLARQVDSVRGLVGALLRTARPLAVTLLAATAGLATLHPGLVGLVLPPVAVVLLVFPVSLRALSRRRRALLLADERITAQIGTSLLAARDIAALGATEQAVAGVDAAGEELRRATVAAAWTGGLRVLMVTTGGYLPLFALLVAGPHLVAAGQVTTGGLVGAALYLTGYLLPAIQSLTGTVSAYITQLGTTLTRLAEAAGPAAEPAAPTVRALPDPARHAVAVTLDGLSFAYGSRAQPVLAGLTVDLAAGDHLAVVGTSGVGKSTLANLITGLERPCSGRVLLDGVPADDLDGAVRPAWVALVPQEAYVFPGTVRENLEYLAMDGPGGSCGAGCDRDTRLADAVHRIGAGPLVARLGGLHGRITDPDRQLSAGERQLLVLVRVYVSPARLVILDEATGHLDPAAEARAESAFAARGGTLVVIAHRLASAARARRVLLVREDGAALGTHEELMTREPDYAELVARWAGRTG